MTATGALVGAGTGSSAGAVVGGVTTLGGGALPGLIGGAIAGALAGAFYAAYNTETIEQAATGGAINGLVAGACAPLEAAAFAAAAAKLKCLPINNALASKGAAAVAARTINPFTGSQPGLPSAAKSFSDFGINIMQWGRGSAAARDRMMSITVEELRGAGMTPELATAWRNFYQNVARQTPSNPSAAGRAELMEWALKLLRNRAKLTYRN